MRRAADTAASSTTTQPSQPAQHDDFVIIPHPITVKIPYGTTVLQPGTKLPVVARSPQTVNVRYLDAVYPIPVTATD